MNSKHFTDALLPGTKLLWFDILKVLGKGGFGITYLGKDTNTNQHVAIKEYLPSNFASRSSHHDILPNSPGDAKMFEWGLDRFIKEAQTLAKFNHPCIVRVLSFFRSNHTAYMVMEYVEGEGMDVLLRQSKTLDEEVLKKIVPILLDGLEVLHKADFIHRDIKPPNIFIRKNNGLPVILDFGSARQSIAGEGNQMTSLLSLGYSPFEQYDSSGERQGPWSDIYAMGGVLYRSITGQKPLEATLRITARLRNAPDPLPSAESLGEGRYSPSFLRAVDKALMVLEGDRPQSVGEWRLMLFEDRAASATEEKAQPDDLDLFATEGDGSQKKRKKNSWRSFIASMDACSTHVGESDAQEKVGVTIPGFVAPTPGTVRRLPSAPPRQPTTVLSGVSSKGNRQANVAPGRLSGVKTDTSLRAKEKDDGSRIFSGETASIREVGTLWVEPVTNMEFVWIPGGVFTLGASADALGRESDERPERDIKLDGFWIGKYPVTWGKWRRIMGDYPPGLFMKSKANYPVERIRWTDVQKFLVQLVRVIGTQHAFRLPTEAEWECAARAGAHVLPSPEEETLRSRAELIQDYAWYKGNSRGQTQPIGTKEANAWGIYDMLGNVWEWVGDRYQADYYGVRPKANPQGPEADPQGPKITGVMRVARGGGWGTPPQECWPTNRHRFVEKTATVMLGFRLVRVD